MLLLVYPHMLPHNEIPHKIGNTTCLKSLFFLKPTNPTQCKLVLITYFAIKEYPVYFNNLINVDALKS